MAAAMQDDSILIWDDPPSSPFITHISDTSRKASRTTEDGFDDTNTLQTPVAATRIFSRGSIDGDKENQRPSSIGASLLMTTPIKAPAVTENNTATRECPGTDRTLNTQSSVLESKNRSPMTVSTSRRSMAQTTMQEGKTPSRSKPSRAQSTDIHPKLESMEETNIDDTCFSTFSAVPEMTIFANLRPKTPAKTTTPGSLSSRTNNDTTPRPTKKRRSTSRSPSPSSQRHRAAPPDEATASLLIDFTQQFESLPHSSPQRMRIPGLTPSRTESNLSSYLSSQRRPAAGRQSMSPSKTSSNLLNLLDFELPPPPTPKSAPQFSAREVESIKSGLQSQIGSLSARLAGREAEVESLKKALEDAERRVGRAEEEARMEKVRREAAESEKEGWEKRGVEVEKVLANVREEVVNAENEREALEGRVVEAERKAEDLESRNLELYNRLAGTVSGDQAGVDVQELVQQQLDSKIEGVSRELHAVYKKKHETKVATLKKSYEARAEKKYAEIQARVDELVKENDDLRTTKDETFSGQLSLNEKTAEIEQCRVQIEEQVASMAGLRSEIDALLEEQAQLRLELEAERVEKGELVAAVDEMLSLQASDSVPSAVVEDFRKSISRPSGLRAPPSALGAMDGGPPRTVPRPSGLARPGPGKSRMMSSIERMGNGRAE